MLRDETTGGEWPQGTHTPARAADHPSGVAADTSPGVTGRGAANRPFRAPFTAAALRHPSTAGTPPPPRRPPVAPATVASATVFSTIAPTAALSTLVSTLAAAALAFLLALPLAAPARAVCGANLTDPGTDPARCPLENDGAGSPAPPDPGSAPPAEFAPTTSVGNPLDLLTGNKRQREIDFALPGAALAFQRTYNSANADYDVGLGAGWHHSYALVLLDAGNGARELIQSDGRRLRFVPGGTDAQGRPRLVGHAPNEGELIVLEAEGEHRWTLPDGRHLRFRGSFLVEIDWPDQRRLTLFYRQQRLASVTDEQGRTLAFAYTPGRRSALPGYDAERHRAQPGTLSAVTLPDGRSLGYDYDERGNLTRVRFPDGTAREYHYEAAKSGWPNHLTGLTERTGVRIATWRYDEHGRATLSERADGVERVTLEHPDPAVVEMGAEVETLVTNSLGGRSAYRWVRPDPRGPPRLLSASGPGCATCPPTGMAYAYDAAGRLSSESATGEGSATRVGRTDYRHDERGRVTSIERTDASGRRRPLERREYDGDARLPARVIRPSVDPAGEFVTTIRRDDAGRVIELTERGRAPSVAVPGEPSPPATPFVDVERTTRFVHEGGRLVRLDGPREDVADITHFDWDERNRLIGVRAPLSPSVRVDAHDELGRPTRLQVGSRSPSLLSYGATGEIERIEWRGVRTGVERDAEGRVVASIDGDGRRTLLSRDEAGRIVSVVDAFGRVASYRYDSEGRAEGHAIFAADGSLVRDVSLTLDESGRTAGRRERRRGPDGTFESGDVDRRFDHHGRLQRVVDRLTGAALEIENASDERAVAVTDALGRTLTYLSDALGREAGRIDARGNRSEVLRDDFGRRVGSVDPDTGAERLELDRAGDVVVRVRDGGGRTTYVRDAAGRVLTRRSPDGHVTRWRYDPAHGSLASVANEAGSETYERDREGQLLRHTRELGGHAFTTSFTYDVRGRTLTRTLPGGQTLRYRYHADGRAVGTLEAISRVGRFGFGEEPIVSAIDLERRDGSAGWTAHNGIETAIEIAPGGEITSIESGGVLDLDYRHRSGRIVEIVEDGRSHAYHYGGGYLRGARTPEREYRYEYDAGGNRLLDIVRDADGGLASTRYAYAPDGAGNRLLEALDPASGRRVEYTYGAGGTPSSRGELVYRYDSERRPLAVRRGGALLARYAYDGLGQRIAKTLYAEGEVIETRHFLYEERRLLAETDGEGNVLVQYLYLDGTYPVAAIEPERTIAIHPDHLGTPRRATGERGELVWSARYDPFGKAEVMLERVRIPLRLPGQYADEETGTHYNHFRDYDPGTGRYLTADPFGHGGGINAYAYAGLDPIGHGDPLGLVPGSWLTEHFRELLDQGHFAFVQTVPIGVETVAALFLLLNGPDVFFDGQSAIELGQADISENYFALVEEVRLYDPTYGDAHNGDWVPTESDIHRLGGYLREQQRRYIAGGTCGPNFDADLYQRAQDAQTLIELLERDIQAAGAPPVAEDGQPYTSPEGVRFATRELYRSARSAYEDLGGESGTGISFADWVAAGSPGAGASGGGQDDGRSRLEHGIYADNGGELSYEDWVTAGSPIRGYPNQLPERLGSELATAEDNGVQPLTPNDPGFAEMVATGERLIWAIDESGRLTITPRRVHDDINHPILTGGEPVLSAGEVEIVADPQGGYVVLDINNESGHYRPSNDSLELARLVFSSYGIRWFF